MAQSNSLDVEIKLCMKLFSFHLFLIPCDDVDSTLAQTPGLELSRIVCSGGKFQNVQSVFRGRLPAIDKESRKSLAVCCAKVPTVPGARQTPRSSEIGVPERPPRESSRLSGLGEYGSDTMSIVCC